MKKSYVNSLLVVLVVAIGFAACKKEDKAVPPTKENLSGSYKLTGMTMKSGSSPEQSVYSSFVEDCAKDDIYKLNADFSAEVVDAGVQCDPAGGYSTEWGLSGTNTITIDGDQGEIKKFDGKTLVVSATDNSTGTEITLTTTYSKQ